MDRQEELGLLIILIDLENCGISSYLCNYKALYFMFNIKV